MRLDAATHARLALIALLGVILACAAVGGVGEQLKHPIPARVTDLDPGNLDAFFRRPNDADTRHLALLDRLLHRTPVAAELKTVTRLLGHPNWQVAGRALQVLRTHDHTELAKAELQLLERALAHPRQVAEPSDYVHQQRAKLLVVRDLLQSLSLSSVADCHELLVQVLERSPDGIARAQAMEILATQPPVGWRRWVCAALDDPSERVRLVALDIISQHQWPDAAMHVEGLASSPRPSVRRRATDVLERFGRRAEPIEYGDSVIHAAGDLADTLWQAGMEMRDIIPAGTRNDDELIIEMLDRRAEDYLDRTDRSNGGRIEDHGVLLLAAAARSGRRKLTLRLWEHEISRTDTDEELLNLGLQSLARNRILAGLAAYRRGDKTGALQELSSVAKLAEAAGPSSSIQVYVRQTGAISAAIWERTIYRVGPEQPIGPATTIDPVARLAARLLDRLDLADPDHRTEAHRRIDAWCGLAPSAEAPTIHRTPLAN